MNWNDHYVREGEHAFLSASNNHWLNYTPGKLETVYRNNRAKEEGVELHDFASKAIRKRIKLAKNKTTLSQFVNDCIGFNMESEQMVYYSPNAFGTADAISFKDNILRIFDYKSGILKASFKQLDVYAAFFCLEYGIDPTTISIEQRIYQNNSYTVEYPEGEYIRAIMNQTIEFDNFIEALKKQL